MDKSNYELIVSFEASQEIEDAVGWYESQKEGLGIEFFLQFEEVTELLKNNPEIYAKVYDYFRKALIQKFPYAIYYAVNHTQKIIDIVAVFHNKKNPEVIKTNLDFRT